MRYVVCIDYSRRRSAQPLFEEADRNQTAFFFGTRRKTSNRTAHCIMQQIRGQTEIKLCVSKDFKDGPCLCFSGCTTVILIQTADPRCNEVCSTIKCQRKDIIHFSDNPAHSST